MKSLIPYDLKVFVTGPFQSGKTTLVHALDPRAVSIDRPLPRPYRGESSTTTTGFDLGRVLWIRKHRDDIGVIVPVSESDTTLETDDGLTKKVEVRGVPGMLHFKFVRDTMRSGTNVVLLVVDSSDRDNIKDALAHLDEARTSFGGVDIVVLANKQDREDAAPPEEVARWLGVDRTIGVSAKDAEQCRRLLATILHECVASHQGANVQLTNHTAH